MMSHLPIEFILLPPTYKRNLIGCYSNLYTKVAERKKKTKKQNTSKLSHLKTSYSIFLPLPFVLVHHVSV